jgi:Skp family chaperone for outer membrane proteins
LSKVYLSIAAAALLGAAVPALATAAPAPAARGATPAAGAQQVPTRAALLKNLDTNFKAVDANGDGVLSQPELAAAEAKGQQQRLTQIRNRVDAEFTKLDTNKDGMLSKAEFMAAAPSSAGAAPNGSNILAQLDKNKDGKISADEYRAPVLSRFDRMDTNHDGTLSATERQAAQAANTPRKK